jgi:hypothetical protein
MEIGNPTVFPYFAENTANPPATTRTMDDKNTKTVAVAILQH